MDNQEWSGRNAELGGTIADNLRNFGARELAGILYRKCVEYETAKPTQFDNGAGLVVWRVKEKGPHCCE